VIISGGFNVYAADIEVLLLRHPDVIDAAVIGHPERAMGEQPMALCVCRPGAAATEAQIREWANGQLGKTQRLVAVEFSRLLAAQYHRQDHEARVARALLGRPQRQDLRERR